jgi:hypothetical protein
MTLHMETYEAFSSWNPKLEEFVKAHGSISLEEFIKNVYPCRNSEARLKLIISGFVKNEEGRYARGPLARDM